MLHFGGGGHARDPLRDDDPSVTMDQAEEEEEVVGVEAEEEGRAEAKRETSSNCTN
jgi:hypothetical protein